MQVPRSLQSTRRLRASAPISSTFFAFAPGYTSGPAHTPQRNPVAGGADIETGGTESPISSCTRQAVFRKDALRRGRFRRDQIQFCRTDPGIFQRSSRRLLPPFGQPSLPKAWARTDSCPLPDPGIARLHHLFQIFIFPYCLRYILNRFPHFCRFSPYCPLAYFILKHFFSFQMLLIFKVYHQNSFCQPFYCFSISHFYNETMFGIFSKLFFRILLFWSPGTRFSIEHPAGSRKDTKLMQVPMSSYLVEIKPQIQELIRLLEARI